MLNVVIYAYYFYPSVGGAEQTTSLLATSLSLGRSTVRVVTRTRGGTSRSDFPFGVIRRPSLAAYARIIGWSEVVLMNGFDLATFVLCQLLRKP